MKTFRILSPTGHVHIFTAETIFAAIQKAVEKDGYQFSNAQYARAKRPRVK